MFWDLLCGISTHILSFKQILHHVTFNFLVWHFHSYYAIYTICNMTCLPDIHFPTWTSAWQIFQSVAEYSHSYLVFYTIWNMPLMTYKQYSYMTCLHNNSSILLWNISTHISWLIQCATCHSWLTNIVLRDILHDKSITPYVIF